MTDGIRLLCTCDWENKERSLEVPGYGLVYEGTKLYYGYYHDDLPMPKSVEFRYYIIIKKIKI